MFALRRFLRFLRSDGLPVPSRYFSGAHGTPSRPTKTKRLRVLVDMDGVIADFEGGFLKKYRAKYPNEPYISLEDRRGFWVSTQYGELRSDLCVSTLMPAFQVGLFIYHTVLLVVVKSLKFTNLY